MMGPAGDDARTVNLNMDQNCVIELPDDTVDETESELSPSSPEAMMREVANDATASIEYVRQVPQPFTQLRVEAAFQAQYTETRLTYVTCMFVCITFLSCARLVHNSLSPEHGFNVHLSIPIGLCVVSLFASLGLLCSHTKLRGCHHAVQAVSNFSFVAVFGIGSVLTVFLSLNGGPVNPFGLAYNSGLILASASFVMAHTEVSLWTFLFNAVFAVAVCMTPGAGISSITGSIGSAFFVSSISRQIMLQHRHSFAAQVRQWLRVTSEQRFNAGDGS